MPGPEGELRGGGGEGGGGGVGAWVRRWWRALVAELVATALLVALGVAALLPRQRERADGALEAAEGAPLTHPALAFGCIVLANVQAFGGVSGAHMNPAVTLAALLHGRVAPGLAAAYVAAQAAGAALGLAALAGLAPGVGPGACTAPGAGVSPAGAACVEALLAGLLALLCCGVWRDHDPRRPDPAVPLKFGFTVTGLVYAGGVLTGASLNPARSLAPALLYPACWTHQWVYWVGPLSGAALGTMLHRLLLPPPPRRLAAPDHAAPDLAAPDHAAPDLAAPDHGEPLLPLRDKRSENNADITGSSQ